nr:NEL domain-containing protein [Pseudomonas monteilii]
MLWLFSQLEVRALVHRETAGLSQMQSERALVRLGRSLYRLQEVDRAAAQKLNRLREAFANEPARLESIDDIETYLAYRVGLAGPLQLPAQPVRMHYLAESLVTVEDINVARAEILSAESDVRLRQSLADQSYWQDYLRNTYFLRFRALVDDQRLALEHAEALVTDGTLSENTYLEQCKALTKELEKKERALIEQLTQEAFMRWQR